MYGVDEEAPIPAPEPGLDDYIIKVVNPPNPLQQGDYEQLLCRGRSYEDYGEHRISL